MFAFPADDLPIPPRTLAPPLPHLMWSCFRPFLAERLRKRGVLATGSIRPRSSCRGRRRKSAVSRGHAARRDREIFKATSGPEALELLQAHDFALALLDIRVASMDEFELAELMRDTARSKGIPIMFITAASPDEPLPMFRGYESGAVDVLGKPIDPKTRKICEM